MAPRTARAQQVPTPTPVTHDPNNMNGVNSTQPQSNAHVSPPRQAPQQLHFTVIAPDIFLYFERDIDSRLRADPTVDREKLVLHTVNYVQDFANTQIDQWQKRLAGMLNIDITTNRKKRKHGPDDNASPDGVYHEDDSADEDDENGGGGKGDYRCLFWENDPDTHAQCATKKYKRVSELRRHIKTHTLPHYCAQCGYRTAEERRLTHHKCEKANEKRYAKATDEEKEQHRKLARMGISVGEMRTILFGSPVRKDPNAVVSDHEEDDRVYSNSHSPQHSQSQSGTHSITPKLEQNEHEFQQPQMIPTPPQAQIGHQMPLPFTPVTTMGMSQPYYPTTMAQVTMGPMPLTTTSEISPFAAPAPGAIHSPRTGQASLYYLDGSPNLPALSDGGSSAPLSPQNHPMVPSTMAQAFPATYAPHEPVIMDHSMAPHHANPFQPPPRTDTGDSFEAFVGELFPEWGSPNNVRSLPQSEIEAMEKNLALQAAGQNKENIRGFTWTDRRGTNMVALPREFVFGEGFGLHVSSRGVMGEKREGFFEMLRRKIKGEKEEKSPATRGVGFDPSEAANANEAPASNATTTPQRSGSLWKKLKIVIAVKPTRSSTATTNGTTPTTATKDTQLQSGATKMAEGLKRILKGEGIRRRKRGDSFKPLPQSANGEVTAAA